MEERKTNSKPHKMGPGAPGVMRGEKIEKGKMLSSEDLNDIYYKLNLFINQF